MQAWRGSVRRTGFDPMLGTIVVGVAFSIESTPSVLGQPRGSK